MVPASWITAVKRKIRPKCEPGRQPGLEQGQRVRPRWRVRLSKARTSFSGGRNRGVSSGRFRQDPACSVRCPTAPADLPGLDADQCRHYRLTGEVGQHGSFA